MRAHTRLRVPLFRRGARGVLSALLLGAATSTLYAGQLASRPADDWAKVLESAERIASLKIDEVVARLQLEPGDVVADIGAGTGLFTAALSRAVAPGGKVYAVEIDKAFLDRIGRRVKEQQLSNVQLVVGRFGDPSLPASDVDVAFMHDVLHHIEARAAYLTELVSYLKPGGRIAVVEFKPGQGPHPDDPKLHVAPQELASWMSTLGLDKTAEYPLAEDKWYVVYARKQQP
jgi:ubiquinone/menaquinone biosynthesis C-methylase UbiE